MNHNPTKENLFEKSKTRKLVALAFIIYGNQQKKLPNRDNDIILYEILNIQEE